MRLVDWEYDGDSHLIAVTVDDDGDGLYDFEIVRNGRWVKTKFGEYVCSLCGEEAPNDGYNCGAKYCYECGAKMDAKE